MSNYHKPRTFRSLLGCCICRAKSSSSRFTDSLKYEQDFPECFQIDDERSGDICNACVLLIKRWKKLPRGSKKNWHHVVDARAGPGGCKTIAIKQKSKQPKDDPDLKFRKIVTKRSAAATPNYEGTVLEEYAEKTIDSDSPTGSEDEASTHSSLSNQHIETSPFLDPNYWKRTQVCCGTVFLGRNRELTIDTRLYKPCWTHRKQTACTGSVSSRSRTDTVSSISSIQPNCSSASPTDH